MQKVTPNRKLLAAVAAVATIALTAAATPVQQRPGLWEITTGPSETALAALGTNLTETERALLAPRTRRECLDGKDPAVGDRLFGGRCTYTRIADADTLVDRTLLCTRPNADYTDHATITGNRTARRYTWVMTTRRIDRATGAELGQTETTEVGQWVGSCAEKR